MKFPDWSNSKLIMRTVDRGGSAIISEDGYVTAFAAAVNGKATLVLNGNTIAACSSHDGWGDTDFIFLPVKAGDSFYVYGDGFSYESYVMFYPFKR